MAHKSLFSEFFKTQGQFTQKYSLFVFFIGIVFLLVSCTGYFRLELELQMTGTAFTPNSSPEYDNYYIMERLFPNSVEAIAIQVQGGKGETNQNILTMDSFLELNEINDKVRSFRHKGFSYSDFCKKENGHCMQDQLSILTYFMNPLDNGAIEFKAEDGGPLDTDAKLLEVVNKGHNVHLPIISIDTASKFVKTTPAHIERDSVTEEFSLQEAVSGTLIQLIDSQFAQDMDTRAWEVALREELKGMNLNHTSLGQISSHIFDDTMANSVVKDMFYLIQSIILLICYSFLVMGYFNRIHSRVSVTMAGLVTIGFSVVECMLLGVLITGQPLNDMHKLIAFLLIGIGQDDVQVLINGFDRALKDCEDPEDQIAQTFSTNGVSITVSSLTSFISFGIGTFSSMFMIRSFSTFAALGILCIWINQFLVFGPLLCYHAYQVHKKESDSFTPCLPDPDHHYEVEVEETQHDEDVPDHEEPSNPQPRARPTNLLNTIFNYWYHIMVKPTAMKILVLLIVIASFGAAQWGVPKVSSKNTPDMFIPSDSEAYQDLVRFQDLSENNVGYQCGFQSQDSEIDQSSQMVQQQLMDLSKIKVNKYQQGNQYSWYEDLNEWVGEGNCTVSGSTVMLTSGMIPPADFYPCLTQLRSVNTQIASFLTFNDDDEIKTSNIQFQFNKPEAAKDTIPMLDSFYAVAEQGPRNTIAWNSSFASMWSLERVLQTELFQLLVSAGMSIMVIILMVFGDVIATAIITFNVVNILLIVYMGIYYWGLYMNIVTLLFLIMSLGISVDYSAHMMHEFLECTGTREERVEKALTNMGPAILHAALSTFLGVCFTILGSGFVWSAFFAIWSTVVISGFFYSTLVMPVFLSLFGPESVEELELDLLKPIASEHLTTEERQEIHTFFKKQDAIKGVLLEYQTVQQMENKNDLKNFLSAKRELLKKIWVLNQEHKISLMSKQLEDTTTLSQNRIDLKDSTMGKNDAKLDSLDEIDGNITVKIEGRKEKK